MPIVAELLVASLAPFLRDDLLRRIATHGVVPADAILDHRTKHAPHIRIETIAARQLERVLAFERIGRVVALQQIVRVIEQHAHIGATFFIHQAQRQTPL